jgi:hypothetical protein
MTDWGAYGLSEIWSVVEGETGEVSWRQVAAWEKMYELCTWHAKQLRDAANNLSHLWPPEHSLAAQKYLDSVAALAMTMTRAADAAIRNALAIRILTAATVDARAAVAAMRTTWDQTQGAEAQRVRITRSLASGASLVPIGPIAPVAGLLTHADDQTVLTWSNRQPIKAMVDTAGGPDVPTDWRATLNQSARDVMTKNDAAVKDAQTYLTPPKASRIYIDQGTPLDPTPSNDGGGATPHIPLPPVNPPSLASIPLPSSFPGSGTPTGPILDGGAVPPPPGSLPMPGPIGQSPPGMPPLPPIVPALPVLGPLAPGGLIPRVPATGTSVPPEAIRTAAPSEHVIAPGTRPVGSGVAPMMMGAAGSKPGKAMGGGVRVAPPGGVIAGDGRRRRRDVDPNDPWAVAEGGPPLLMPDPEPAEHSPGPGVLGIDR